MHVHDPGTLLNKAATQYRWNIANITLAPFCVMPAGGAFMYDCIVAGPLILAVTVALTVNADAHKKRGMDSAPEAGQE